MNKKKILKLSGRNSGFTYISVLVLVMVMGIMLGRSATLWKTIMQRERETELIFRGTQYRDAIRRWYGFDPATRKDMAGGLPGLRGSRPLKDLKDLLQDPESAGKKRYLRKLYLDPLTGKEWGVIRDSSQRIIGVASTSEAAPIKQANFPLDFDRADFVHKKKYQEWQFIYNHVPMDDTGGTVTGLTTPAAP